jgi:hypothetical protein
VPQSQPFEVHFGDGSSEGLLLTHLRAGLYRAEQSTTLDEAFSFGDVIEAEQLSETAIRFLRIRTKSTYARFSYLLSKEPMESKEMNDFLQRVMEAG